MKKAIRLLMICAMAVMLLATSAVYAAADDAPSAETETEADVMAPVDTAAAVPGGTVYSVRTCDAEDVASTTVVDYTADGPDRGLHLKGGSSYYYGAQITGADCGVVIDSADSVYFGSSNGSLPLYDSRGAVSGVIWGGCRPTSIDCRVGFIVDGDITGGVLVEDGASFNCSQAVLLYTAGSGSFCFRNARISCENGILAEVGAEAGDVALRFENGSYSGSITNDSEGELCVDVGHGALLFGDTTQQSGPVSVTVEAGAIWAVENSASLTELKVEEGATVYGVLEQSDGLLTITASDETLQPGTYTPSPVTEELPFGHGPAVPELEDEADELPDAEQAEEPFAEEPDMSGKLFPLVPAAGTEAQDAEEPEAEPADEAEIAEEEQDDAGAEESDAGYDSRLFPLVPASDEPVQQEPAETEEEDAGEEEGQLSARRNILAGVALASPRALSAPPSTLGFAAQLAVGGDAQPYAATALKAGIKTHSFLLEALDNRAVILYNPYCCSAA